jgi:hypothetical protein
MLQEQAQYMKLLVALTLVETQEANLITLELVLGSSSKARYMERKQQAQVVTCEVV